MKDLPADFDGHEFLRDQDGGCWLCFMWDEPAWFWHPEIPAPGTLAEHMAQVREDARLVGLEMLNLAARTFDRAQRWLRGIC